MVELPTNQGGVVSVWYPVPTLLNQKRFRIVQYKIVFNSRLLEQDIEKGFYALVSENILDLPV